MRRASADERLLAGLWALGATALVLARDFAPLAAAWLPGCAWHALTGVACPTCGTTRATLALARGELAAAWLANPLAALGLLAFLAGAAAVPLWLVAGAPLPSGRGPSLRTLRLACATIVGGNWVYLLLRGA